MKTVWKSRKCYQHQKVPGKSWKTDKIYKRSKYQENPEIHESYQKSGNWNIKKKKYAKVWEIPSESKTRILLYLHNIPLNPVSTQCQII